MNTTYFTNKVLVILASLKAGTKPLWGLMNAEKMVDHLRRGILVSLATEKAEIITPSEKLPVYKRFLMSEKPFQHNLPKPKEYSFVKAADGNLDQLKEAFQLQLNKMLTFFKENPEFRSVHPSFGELNVNEWLHLHKKHFTPHFTQFRLI